jgi:hypothetical protein
MKLVDYSSSEEDEGDAAPQKPIPPTTALPTLPSDFYDLYSGIAVLTICF